MAGPIGLGGVIALAILLSFAPLARAGLAVPAPLIAPTISTCTYIPDPRTNTSYVCGDTTPIAFTNVSVFFQVNVSDQSNNAMNVTFYFDYFRINQTTGFPEVNPVGPNRTVQVPWPGSPTATVSANASWTYTAPNANFSSGQYYVNVNVTNDANETDPFAGSTGPFPITVTYNRPPSLNGLQSLNSISPTIKPSNPVIPLVYENVSASDPDTDPVTITWDWGDGVRSVTRTGPLVGVVPVQQTYLYPASDFPLNETPRYVDFRVHVWIDDGAGHNVTYNSTNEFYLDFNSPPTVQVDRPKVGSIWKVNDTVALRGNVTDPEGNPITAYWDFDNRTDSTHIGDPTRNQDALGLNATHIYTRPGQYNVTLWATDGNQLTCYNDQCTNFTTHWRSAVVPITVRSNIAPFVAMSNTSAVAGKTTLLLGAVFDANGDNMTVTWDFGDGSPMATNVTGPSSPTTPIVFAVAQAHVYTEPGNVTYTVTVTDGNATANTSRIVFVQSFNLPPVVLDLSLYFQNGTEARNNTYTVGSPVEVKVSLYDPENDTMSVAINWNDGAMANLSLDPKTAGNCSLSLSRKVCIVSFEHVYTSIGTDQIRNYTILVTVTDNKVYLQQNATGGPPTSLNHTKVLGVIVFITDYQAQGLGPWDWWDYSTLTALVGIPTLLIGRFAWRVHKERQED